MYSDESYEYKIFRSEYTTLRCPIRMYDYPVWVSINLMHAVLANMVNVLIS